MAAAARAAAGARARPSAARRRARALRADPTSRTCRRGWRCSASRGCPPATSRCCARWPPTATSTCSSCTRRPRCGSGCASTRRSSAARDVDRDGDQPAARLLGPRLARAPARARRRPRGHCTRSSTARGTLLGARPAATCARTGRATHARRSQHPGPLLPRPRPPGRGPARRDPAPAGRGPDARAARRDRHVPGHRDVRAADPGHVRRRRRRGRAAEGAPPDLRVRLADRSLRQTNPILGVVARLLELAGARLTASQVLDLADREPVRRRFRLDDDDIARLEEWVRASGIRWGLDADHRAPFRLDGPAERHVARRARPAAARRHDVRGRAAAVRARAAARRRRERRDRPRRPLRRADRPAAGGASTRSRAPKPIADVGGRARRGRRRAHRHRAARRLAARRAAADPRRRRRRGRRATRPSWRCPSCATLLADRLKGRPTRANFRTGHLTICTLVPMRSVPHRVVCLLGLDDGVFPRKAPRDGDDLLLDDPHIGERDARTEDRQLLLDALMAATDRLIVTYTGNDERTNLARPPAVPVGELLDLVGRERRRPAPAAAVRPAQLRAGRAGAGGALELRPRDAARRAGADRRARPRARVPARAAAAARAASWSSSTTSCASSSARCARSCASASASASPTTPTRSRTRCRSSSTGSRSGASASACSTRGWPAPSGATRSSPRSPAARSRPAQLGEPVIDGSSRSSTRSSRAGAAGRPAASLDVRLALPDGRTLSGTVAGRGRRRAAHRHVLAREPAPPDRRLGAAAGRPGRAPGPRVRGGHRRARPRGRRRASCAIGGARRRARARPAASTSLDLYDRGMREPRAAVLPDLGRVRGRRRTARQRLGVGQLPGRGRRARARARPRRSRRSTTLHDGGRARPTSAGTRTRRAASAAGRGGCGTRVAEARAR